MGFPTSPGIFSGMEDPIRQLPTLTEPRELRLEDPRRRQGVRGERSEAVRKWIMSLGYRRFTNLIGIIWDYFIGIIHYLFGIMSLGYSFYKWINGRYIGI